MTAFAQRSAEVAAAYLVRCPDTGITGFTVASGSTLSEVPIRLVTRFPYCVATGTGVAGECADYTVVASEDLVTWLVGRFSSRGVFHATAYPALSFEQAGLMLSRLSGAA